MPATVRARVRVALARRLLEVGEAVRAGVRAFARISLSPMAALLAVWYELVDTPARAAVNEKNAKKTKNERREKAGKAFL